MNPNPPDLSRHPCFDADTRHTTARVHLPVAPRCNVQCRFCNRKPDCLNEGRPGVTSAVLTPRQALGYLEKLTGRRGDIAVTGIAGPGDPMANPQETLETLRLVRERFPEMLLCLATNELDLAAHVPALAALRLSHATITINAVDPAIAARVYAWGRHNRRVHRGEALGRLIVERQLAAVKSLKEHGILVKVNAIILPGVNDHHLQDVARVVAEFGADLMNCLPLLPVAGTPFHALGHPDSRMVARVRLQTGRFLKQMTHCARCRADAAGLVGEDLSPETAGLLQEAAGHGQDPSRQFVAVATLEGALVNQHLGEAAGFMVFGPDPSVPDRFRFVERRLAPACGGGDERWLQLASTLQDCRALLVSAAGPKPCQVLEATGLKVVQMEGLIEEGLAAVFANRPVPPALSRQFQSCGRGATCGGTGTGCG
ncbi:MAG: radical SAM protein [Verrucomicrobiae bacterium]|nr:radical SAM protein [Verrucomicrobiae bacterium]